MIKPCTARIYVNVRKERAERSDVMNEIKYRKSK